MPFIPARGDDAPRLVVERVSAEEWRLLAPLYYQGATDRWLVEAGTTTDLASSPRITVWLVPRFGIYTLGAVLHDWLCRVGIPRGLISPVDADGVFRRVLGELGVPPLLRWLMWAGVRAGAATDPARRAGWWRTAPQVVGIALVAAPLVGPPALAIAVALRVYAVAERAVSRRTSRLTSHT